MIERLEEDRVRMRAATSPSSATASRCETSCTSTISCAPIEVAIHAPAKVAGQAFNIGGGPGQVLSLIDLIDLLERRLHRKIPLRWDDWRPGDQHVYVSDIRKFQMALDWKPEIGVTTGIAQLMDWVEQNRVAF